MTTKRVLSRRAAAAVGAILLWAAPVLAAPSPQERCDGARMKAWGKYLSCVDAVVARRLGGAAFLWNDSLARCRHKYFSNWAKFQAVAYTPSTCIGNRFTDNGDQTVTDNLSGLTWEKKNNAGGVHDKDNTYPWSFGVPYKGNGTAYSYFLLNINENAFGSTNDWRLPTLAELQTILLDFACTAASCECGEYPCIDPALDAINSQPDSYWTGTTADGPSLAWLVSFVDYSPAFWSDKTFVAYVRAVRGGM